MAKHRCIALKIYEGIEKRPYFHKTTRKKISKNIVLSTLEPCTVNLCFIASGRFSHCGSHIISTAKLPIVEHFGNCLQLGCVLSEG